MYRSVCKQLPHNKRRILSCRSMPLDEAKDLPGVYFIALKSTIPHIKSFLLDKCFQQPFRFFSCWSHFAVVIVALPPGHIYNVCMRFKEIKLMGKTSRMALSQLILAVSISFAIWFSRSLLMMMLVRKMHNCSELLAVFPSSKL